MYTGAMGEGIRSPIACAVILRAATSFAASRSRNDARSILRSLHETFARTPALRVSRRVQAEQGIRELREAVDALITIPNQRLLNLSGENTTCKL